MTSERRLAAIMFTDVVGYSSLSQENEELALELLDEHFRLLRPMIPEYSGTEIKTMGDSFLIEFASPLQAVRCAIEFQRLLLKRNLDEPQDRHVTIRIGIHLGDVEHRNGDVFGDGVNIASRIEPLADPGGIAVTRQVYDQVHNKIDWELRSLGTPQLKNITTVVEIFKVDLKWDSSGYALPTRKIQSKQDQFLKIGSVVAVSVIALVGIFFMWRSIAPSNVALVDSEQPIALAVLPFENLSSDSENEYFSDGVSEEILNSLAQIDQLRVTSRQSSFYFKGKDTPVSEIARQLDVSHILAGSVRKAGNNLRITAQLIDVTSDSNIWSTTFDRELQDIFAIQEEVARSITEQLEFQLSAEDTEQLSKHPTENIEAYDYYLQAQALREKQNLEDLLIAIEYLNQAIEREPEFALAYAELAQAYNALRALGNMSKDEVYAKAMENIDRALELDDSISLAYTVRGRIRHLYNLDIYGALEDYRKALSLNPNDDFAHEMLGILLINEFGDREEGTRQLDLALRFNPLSPQLNHLRGQSYFAQGQPHEAMRQFERALILEPRNIPSYWQSILIRIYFQEWEEAEQFADRAIEIDPDSPFVYRNKAILLRLQDRFSEAEAELQKALELNPTYEFALDELRAIKLSKYEWDELLIASQNLVQLNPNTARNHLLLALTLIMRGESESTILAAIEQALKLSPDSVEINSLSAYLLTQLGQEDRAEQLFDRAVSVNPNDIATLYRLGLIDLYHGRYADAIEHFQNGRSNSEGYFNDKGALLVFDSLIAFANGKLGNVDVAQRILEELLGKPKETYLPNATAIAIAYMGLGKTDEVFHWLDIAWQDHDNLHFYSEDLDAGPLFEEIRDNRRFIELLNKVGLSDQ